MLAFGPPEAGRSALMAELARKAPLGGGEGVNALLRPDACLADGAQTGAATWQVRALHTPGHFGNHLRFTGGARIFSRDVVMGWSTTLAPRRHGGQKWRVWREIHRGIDAETLQVRAVELTRGPVGDAPFLPDRL